MPAGRNELFRFVSLRAPRTVEDPASLVRHPAAEGGEASDLMESLRGAADGDDPVRERRRVAAAWLESADGLTSEVFGGEEIAALRRLGGISVPEGATDGEVADLIRAALGPEEDRFANPAAVADLRLALMDRIAATTVLSEPHPPLRDDLLATLRGLEVAHRSVTGSDASRVRAAFAVRPVLPRWLFTRPTPPPRDPGQPGDGEPPVEEPGSLLTEHIAALYAARESLRAQRAGRRESPQEVRVQPGGDGGNRQLFPDHSPFRRPWVFDDTTIGGLDRRTRRTLRRAGISLPDRPVDDVLADVEDQIGRVTSALARLAGPRKAISIGRRLSERRRRRPAGPTLFALGSGLGEASEAVRDALDRLYSDRLRLRDDLPPLPRGILRATGIADLKLVERTLLAYEPAEIAHIENVLRSERKDRTHRRRHVTEQVLVEETERERETERDLQTNERFELERESERTLEEDMDVDAGVTVTASYGVVTVESHADFAFSRSRSEAERAAATFARDVTDRSLRRVRERVREQRSRRTIDEIEETNFHGLNNEEGSEHVIGIYRWVEQLYRAEIVNYGRRMMLEFFVPEPAAFYIEEVLQAPPDTDGVRVPPELGDLAPSDIAPETYLALIQEYEVEDASPPPPASKVLGVALEKSNPDERLSTAVNASIEIPTGYVAKEAFFQYAGSWLELPFWLDVMVGKARFRVEGSTDDSRAYLYEPGMNDERDAVPIAVRGIDLAVYSMTIEVRCERTPEELERWQIETYGKIVTANRAQAQAYDDARRAAAVAGNLDPATHPPGRNREIEREELKKGAISLLAGTRYEELAAIRSEAGVHGYPEMLGEPTRELGDRVRFFEQAFEWRQMAYVFYPYFWGRKGRWRERHPLDDADPMFGRFLRAGGARVVVPVRPAFNEAIAHFLVTGERWGGAEPPVVDDPLFVPILEELREAADAPRDGVREGEPWELRLPTALVWLQPEGDLPDFRDE